MSEKTKLAIFDLDGTLFDTRKVNFLSYKAALSPFGAAIDYDFFAKNCNGSHYSVFVPKILRNAGNDETSIAEKTEIVHRKKKELYSTFLNESAINRHLFKIIECIKNEYFVALATTASKKNAEEILAFYKKENEFDLILTAEDVQKKKPDPEVFLKTMAHFGISGKDTLIFEDSEVGIEAAEKTGATIFTARGFA